MTNTHFYFPIFGTLFIPIDSAIDDFLNRPQADGNSQHRRAELLGEAAAVALTAGQLGDAGAEPWTIPGAIDIGQSSLDGFFTAGALPAVKDKVNGI